MATPFSLSVYSSFFVGIGVYIVMGMVIMRVKYEATGTDIIPNKAFWMSFPGLIKVTILHLVWGAVPQLQVNCLAMKQCR